MLVNHEIKSQLAKLLATEDLIVENKNVETAAFNTHTRVLTLPTWDRASNNIYDSLVAHEVGHALYTPDTEWWKEVKINPSIVNIVEDARVEKLMKRRYGGIAKTFHTGYNELFDQDFFQIKYKDVSTMSAADRVNLFYKVGSFIDIPFNLEEKIILDKIDMCETFDDTLRVSKLLHEYCMKELEKRREEEANLESELEMDGDLSQGSPTGESKNDDTDQEDEQEFEVKNGQEVENGDADENDSQPQTGGGQAFEQLEVETADNLEEALRDLTNPNRSRENEYIELPEVKLENIIISNSEIHDRIKSYWNNETKFWDEKHYYYDVVPNAEDRFKVADDKFLEFKKSARKEVNYLVKEFECKKSADAYARSTVSRTGILDTTKLHTYKYNEDLFKKVNIVPDGKNHGLIFILDWSGSMNQVLLDTLKQLYNLLWFCKKVNIPFEVYAFTNDCPNPDTGDLYEKKPGQICIESTFSLMNLFTSKVKSAVLEEQMIHIFRLGCIFNRQDRCYYDVPIGMNLSGTPLNEALICLHKILPQFQKDNKVQKVQCVVLTDGESSCIRYHKEYYNHYTESLEMGYGNVSDNCLIRNRKTGHTYACRGDSYYWTEITDTLITDLRQTFPNTNFIGIRILPSREAGSFVRKHIGYDNNAEYEKIMKHWKKEKCFSLKDAGYHTYFGLSSNSLSVEDTFEVQEDATKAEIKKAFGKSLKGKKMNKKILGEFIELVA